MRRLLFIVCAVFAAASVVSFSTLAAHAQSEDQYGSSDGTEETKGLQETTAPEEPSSGALPSEDEPVEEPEGDFVSQGSTVDPDAPAAVAAQEDLAVEESLPEYSQVVDNATKGAFRAPGWEVQRGSLSHGGSYASSASGAKPARFEVEIPTTNDYSVYAWWPQAPKNGLASTFTVEAAGGAESDKVDQRNEGGMWIMIGSFAMEKGQRQIEVAPGDGGQAVADAVMVIRGEMALPPEEPTAGASAQRSAGTDSRATDSKTTDSRRITRFSGRDIVQQAKKHRGDNYKWGTCTKRLKSCTCLTRVSVSPFGHKLPMTENGQWRYDRSTKVSRKRPGDEVFFKNSNGVINHVGIYSGNGYLVHASTYFGEVVNSEMQYVKGYSGAKRFKSR